MVGWTDITFSSSYACFEGRPAKISSEPIRRGLLMVQACAKCLFFFLFLFSGRPTLQKAEVRSNHHHVRNGSNCRTKQGIPRL
jgi:hypothetical protein